MTASEQVKIWESKNKAALDGLNAELRSAVDGVTKALSGVSVEPKKKPSKDELAKKFLEKYGQQKLKLDDEILISVIEIVWNEGSEDLKNQAYLSSKAFLTALKSQMPIRGSKGYNKVKFKITYTNGVELEYRVDLGYASGDFNAKEKGWTDANHWYKLLGHTLLSIEGIAWPWEEVTSKLKAGTKPNEYKNRFREEAPAKKEEAKKPDEKGRTDITLDKFVDMALMYYMLENLEKKNEWSMSEIAKTAFKDKYMDNIIDSYEQDYNPIQASKKLTFQVNMDELDALVAKQTASDILKKYKK
jgi:hypothetical protein